jgi:hypothetical protein
LFNEFLGPKVHNPALGQLGPNKEHAMKIKKEIKRHQIHWEDLGNSSRPQKGITQHLQDNNNMFFLH